MKILSGIFIFFILPAFAFAQWEFQNPTPSNAFLNDIQFIGENNGWAVGRFGTILHTSNGGESWEEQHSDASTFHILGGYSTYHSVCFINSNTGWVAGGLDAGMAWYGGTLMYTSDGGSNWTEIFSEQGEDFFDVCFTNSDNGWLIGEAYQLYGFIRHTDDGGITWNTIDTTMGSWPRKLCFVDENNGWIVGDHGMILHTGDGGQSWISQGENIEIDIKSVCFTDINNGWIAGTSDNKYKNAKIFSTTDGGMTWDSIAGFNQSYNNYLGNIFFTDPDHGWISYKSESYSGVYLYPITYGVWNPMEYYYFPFRFYNSVNLYFNDPNNGWAVGGNVIMKTTNSGQAWESKNSITNLDFESVVFADQDNGWALASSWWPAGSAIYKNIIFHTNNGGSTWDSIAGGYTSYSTNEHLQSISFIDQNHGWASGINLQGCFILKTVNGGMDWEKIYPNSLIGLYRFCSLYFVDAISGWAIFNEGYPSNTDRVIYTSDGGYTWYEMFALSENYHLNSLFFYNENIGWAVGKDTSENSYIINTVNGGNSWQEQVSGSYGEIYSVHFINQDTGWAVGENTILNTTNGGENWLVQEYNTTYPYSTYRSVYFVDGHRGWIAGNKDVGYCLNSSVILFTDDGGITWDLQIGREGGQFNSIYAVNQNYVWAVGNYGTILHTDNGGIIGIENPEKETIDLKIYPNPSRSTIVIELGTLSQKNTSLSIYNLNGQQLINQSIVGPKAEIDISNLLTGIYIVKVWHDKEVMVRKVIKQ